MDIGKSEWLTLAIDGIVRTDALGFDWTGELEVVPLLDTAEDPFAAPGDASGPWAVLATQHDGAHIRVAEFYGKGLASAFALGALAATQPIVGAKS